MQGKRILAGIIACMFFTGCSSDWYEHDLAPTNTEQTEVITKPVHSKSEESLEESKESEKSEEVIAFEKQLTENTEAEKLRVAMGLNHEPYTNVHQIKGKELEGIDILVNKYNSLPLEYIPDDLESVVSSGENGTVKMRKEASKAFNQLVEWAKGEGIELSACSAFRDAQYQANLWNNGKAQGGIEYADKWWTRMGFSEHQTGLAVDIRLFNDRSELDAVLKYPEAYNKLLANMDDFGFILRYPENKKDETLIEPESWHLRYVGKEIAKEINKKQITFEEYKAREYLAKLYKEER